MIVYVHQPEYLPWVGFFDKMARCDTFVILDDVQYEHGGFQNRNRVRTREGWIWLTVPIAHSGDENRQKIADVRIRDGEWKTEHSKAIWTNYKKAPFFDEYFPQLQEAYLRNWTYLVELDIFLIKRLARMLGIEVSLERSSKMNLESSEKNQRLVEICKMIGADSYLCGSGAQSYFDRRLFEDEGIEVLQHHFVHPVYGQRFDGFEPKMSVIDLIFNKGPDALDVISSCGAALKAQDQGEVLTAARHGVNTK